MDANGFITLFWRDFQKNCHDGDEYREHQEKL